MEFSSRRAISDSRLGASLAILTLAVIVVGIGFSGVASAQLDQIRGLQAQLASTSTSASARQTTTGAAASAPVPSITRHYTLVGGDVRILLSDGVYYDAWAFNGTVPGPTVWATQGDRIVFKFVNNASMGHSIDFHAAEVDWSTDYGVVPPGQTKFFNFTVNYPGVFMYHCGTPPVLQHISNGMYGAIIVRPNPPPALAPGGEFVLIQSEFYLNDKANPDGAFSGNFTKMLAATPDYVVFNGAANRYQKSPLVVQPNQLVRIYFLNVGPSIWSAFHVIGALMDTVYIDGNPANLMRGLQTLSVPPSGGATVEMYFRDPGGKNPFVSHDFADASKGALGVFAVAGGASATTSTPTTTQRSISGTVVQVGILQGAATNTASPGYSSPTITVVIGKNNTVAWTNRDNAPHTVTALDKSFDSGNMNQGDTYTFSFTTPGTYQYVCLYHPWMKGTVVVTR